MILGKLTILELAKLCESLEKCTSCPFYKVDIGCAFTRTAPENWERSVDLNENI